MGKEPAGWAVIPVRKSKLPAPQVVAAELDNLFRCLDGMVSGLRRLRSEMCDTADTADPSQALVTVAHNDIGELAVAMQLSAADVLKQALEWKCALLTDPERDDDPQEGSLCAGSARAIALVHFLDKAVAVGNGLSACLAVFETRKEDVR